MEDLLGTAGQGLQPAKPLAYQSQLHPTAGNLSQWTVFIYSRQTKWLHFWWFHLPEDLYNMFWVTEWPQTGRIFLSLVGSGFLFVCGTFKRGVSWGARDPTLFLGQTEPMGLRPSPPLFLGSGWLGPQCLIHFAPQPTEHHCLLLVAGLVI